MKAHRNTETEGENNKWLCHICRREADPIYFVEGKKLCEQCRKDVLSKQKKKARHGS